MSQDPEHDKTQLFSAKGVSLHTFENLKWCKVGTNCKIKLWIINKETHNDKFRIEMQYIKSKSNILSYWLIPSTYADKQNNDKQCVIQYRIHRSQLKDDQPLQTSTSFTLALTFKNSENREQFKKCIFVDIYTMQESEKQQAKLEPPESSVSYSESESWSIYDNDDRHHIKDKHSHSLTKQQSIEDNKDNKDNKDNNTNNTFKDVLFLTFGGFEFAKTTQDLSLSHTDSYKRFAMLCPYDILENDEIYDKFIASLKNLEEETKEYIEIYNPYSKLSSNLSTWMCYRCCLENANKYQNCRLCGDSINYYRPDKEQQLNIQVQHLIEPTNYIYTFKKDGMLTYVHVFPYFLLCLYVYYILNRWIPSLFRIKLNKAKKNTNNYYVTIKHEIDGLNNVKYKNTICKYIRMIFAKMIPALEWIFPSMRLNTSSNSLWKLNIVVSMKCIKIPTNKIDAFHQFMHEGYKHECVEVVGLYFFDINIPESYESTLQIEFCTSTSNDKKIFSSTTKLKKERFDIKNNGSCVVFNNKSNELYYRYKLSTKAYRFNDLDNIGQSDHNASFKVLSFMMLGKKYNREDIQRNVPDAPLKYRTVLEIWCRAFKIVIVDIVMDLILLYFKQRAKENNRNTRMKDTSLSSLLSTLN